MNLTVRECTIKDLSLIVDYWILSSDEHLKGMGVDISKFPDRVELTGNLFNAIKNKKSFCIIWEHNNLPIGHTNANQIIIGKEAHMHLHLWQHLNRQKGLGIELLRQSLPLYFNTLKIDTLYCEPYAHNLAPNKVLKKVGFSFVKTYKTTPGPINFEQDVNQWILTKEAFNKLHVKS